MARQSIVDFFKGAQTAAKADPSPGMQGVSRIETEKAYVAWAQPVLNALSAGTPLSEGDLFKSVDASNITEFRAAVEEMKARGLVRVVQFVQPFNEPVYGLASGSGHG